MSDLIEKLVKEEAAAEILNISVSTLRNSRTLRTGPPYVKVGRSVRYSLSDLKNYIDQRRIKPGGNGSRARKVIDGVVQEVRDGIGGSTK